MEELDRDVRVVGAPKVRQAERLEVPAADEADDVVEEQDPVDRWEALTLVCDPVDQEVGDDTEQPVHGLGIGLDRGEELRRPHQECGDVQRTAGDGEPDLVASALDLGLEVREPLDRERQQAVLARVRSLERIDVLHRPQHLLCERKRVLLPDRDRAKGGRLGAHAVLGPETGQEHRLRSIAFRLSSMKTRSSVK